MKALIQRVARASVKVGEEVVGKANRGFVVFIGAAQDDSEEDARYLAEKIYHIRLFPDEKGKFNLSIADIGGEVLVVSQFTLMAEARKGRRPDFIKAAPPDIAEPLIEKFTHFLREKNLMVATGKFGQHMMVEIHNDGPVTLMLDSKEKGALKM